jgi:hypothetical protein
VIRASVVYFTSKSASCGAGRRPWGARLWRPSVRHAGPFGPDRPVEMGCDWVKASSSATASDAVGWQSNSAQGTAKSARDTKHARPDRLLRAYRYLHPDRVEAN